MTPVLSARDTAQARAQGIAAAQRRRGYDDRAYQLFAVPDTLRIARGQGLVDAILVGTPYERTRYACYFAAFQQETCSPGQAQTIARGLRDTVAFIVFVHSRSDKREERNFLGTYRDAAIEAGGRRIAVMQTVPFGPALDNYTMEDKGVVMRWVGSVTFRFDVRSAGRALERLHGTLVFRDESGREQRYPFDLSRYR